MGAQDRTSRAELVLRLARSVTARHDVEDVLTETFRCLRPIVTFGGGSIQLLDDDGWIQLAATDPPAPAHVYAQAVPLATSVAGRVILTEQSIYLPDLEAENLHSGKAVSAGVRSYLGVPLVADGAAIGLLQVDSPEPNAWDDSDREVFFAVAPIVAASIQNARAHARASAARAQAAASTRRMQEARHAIAALRAATAVADAEEIERVLTRLELLVGDAADAGGVPSRLLRSRVSVA